MDTRFLWGTGSAIALCGGPAAATISTSDDPATALMLCTAVSLHIVGDSGTPSLLPPLLLIKNILSLDFRKEVAREQGSSMKFTSGPHVSFKNYVSEMETRVSSLVNTVFEEFDPVPIASTSLAQVHVAHLRDGRKIVDKVQHTHMIDTEVADCATVELIMKTLHKFFPSFDCSLLKMYASQCFPRMPELLRRLPRVILLMLETNDCL